jgi:U-box domain
MLSEELVCPISLELFNDPILVPCCGKTFSRRSLINTFKIRKECPLCRGSLSSFNLNSAPKNRILESIVELYKKNQPDSVQKIGKKQQESSLDNSDSNSERSYNLNSKSKLQLQQLNQDSAYTDFSGGEIRIKLEKLNIKQSDLGQQFEFYQIKNEDDGKSLQIVTQPIKMQSLIKINNDDMKKYYSSDDSARFFWLWIENYPDLYNSFNNIDNALENIVRSFALGIKDVKYNSLVKKTHFGDKIKIRISPDVEFGAKDSEGRIILEKTKSLSELKDAIYKYKNCDVRYHLRFVHLYVSKIKIHPHNKKCAELKMICDKIEIV